MRLENYRRIWRERWWQWWRPVMPLKHLARRMIKHCHWNPHMRVRWLGDKNRR